MHVLHPPSCFLPPTGNIKDGDDPLTQMASFFSFLAQSVDEEVVYWTEPYLGFSTGAMQTTAATPIFENSEFKTLLGVVGVDVHLGLVQDKFGTSTDQASFVLCLFASFLGSLKRSCSEPCSAGFVLKNSKTQRLVATAVL